MRTPATLLERTHGRYVFSADGERLDREPIHRQLSQDAYWARGRPRTTSDAAIYHSYLVIGAYDSNGAQVAFTRMVTDLATFALLCHVFVVPDHRGTGLGTALVGAIVAHPDVVDLKWQFLATADAHGVYARFGYAALDDPTRWMHGSNAS